LDKNSGWNTVFTLDLFFFFVIFLLMVFVMGVMAFLTLLEHKVLGYIRICKDSNKVGFVGIFQPFRDAIKLFSREQYFPVVSSYLIYYFSPFWGVFSLFWFGCWFFI